MINLTTTTTLHWELDDTHPVVGMIMAMTEDERDAFLDSVWHGACEIENVDSILNDKGTWAFVRTQGNLNVTANV